MAQGSNAAAGQEQPRGDAGTLGRDPTEAGWAAGNAMGRTGLDRANLGESAHPRLRRRALLTMLAAPAIAAAPARAQPAWPTQSISLVIPFAPGGPTDAVARLMAESLGRDLGQNVVVENAAGGGGTIGALRVAQARPDGHTLLLHNIGMATAPALYRRLPYDPVADFECIGLITPVPMVWVARPDFPAHDFAAAIALIRRQREGINLAHAGLGSGSQLCGTLLQAQLQAPMTPIVFRGTGPIYPELLANRVDLVCDQTTGAIPQIAGGKVHALAVASPHRLPQLPNVPTAAEAGLPGFEVTIWHGLYAPKGTPPAIIARANQALRASLADPRVIRRLDELGAAPEPMDRVTPAAHRAFLISEIARWRPLLQAAGEYAD